MNKQEALKRVEAQKKTIIELSSWAVYVYIVELIKSIDEPETGSADEAPRYLKNILARLRELPLHDREVWLKVIMSEFKQDFSHAKWREGYEQGKIEGMLERDKVKVPEFVAEYIKYVRDNDWDLQDAINFAEDNDDKNIRQWMYSDNNIETFAKAWLDGYEVEKEPRYTVKIKTVLGQYLGRYYLNNEELTPQFIRTQVTGKEKLPTFTQKELEEADFGWVFDCDGVEIEEVE